MKRVIIPVLALSLALFSGCKWCCKETDPKKQKVAQLKTLDLELSTINKQVEQKLAERNKNEGLIKIQKVIQEKAGLANAQIQEIVKKDASLKTLNDEIVKNRKVLMDQKVDNKVKQAVHKKTMELIAKFKENNMYKAQIEPIEEEIKTLSIEFNKLNAGYRKSLSELSKKKQDLMTKIEIIKKSGNQMSAKNKPVTMNKKQEKKA